MRKLLFSSMLLSAAVMVSIACPAHTFDTHTELKPVPSSFQIAKSHFLPQYQSGKLVFEKEADCSAYPLTFCSGYKIPDPASHCPGNSIFFSNCICPDYFKTCELPYFGAGAECDDKFISCEEDTERACMLENPDYTNSCPAGTKPDPANRCSYDQTFSLCCNTCSGYDETEIKDGYDKIGECTGCDGKTRYKTEPHDCGSAFFLCDNGPNIGAKECKSGEQTLYSSCKPNCGAEYNLSVCPANAVCNECDGKYKITGCAANFIDEEKYWNGE